MVTITENQLHNIVIGSINKVLNEAFNEIQLPFEQMGRMNTFNRIQALVDQANEANQKVIDAGFGSQFTLMDTESRTYSLTGPIKLLKNGYIIFPFKDVYKVHKPEKIKVFTRTGGKIKLYKDPFDQDWSDAKRLLNNVIADAQRNLADNHGYDPNWEEKDENGKVSKENVKAVRDFNKSIGVRAGARDPRDF